MVLDDFYAASVVSSCNSNCGLPEMDHLPLVVSDHWESDYRGEEGSERSFLSYRGESEGLVKSLSMNFTKKDDGTYKLHDVYMNVYNLPKNVGDQQDEAESQYFAKANIIGGGVEESLLPQEGSDTLVKWKDMSGCEITLTLHGRAPEEGRSLSEVE